jgi:glutamate-5-semialdehyde dehydrogenase
MNNKELTGKIWKAKKASLKLAQLSREVKDTALRNAARAILDRKEEIFDANNKDLVAGKILLVKGQFPKPLLDRLKLDKIKILEISKMIDSIANLDDPVGKTLYAMKMDIGLEVFKVTVPFGVIVSIFESRPDALPQIASLCIKSGNSVLLKGGSEALNSNKIIFQILNEAFLTTGLPVGCIQLVEGRTVVNTLLKAEGLIDLIIPRGSNKFIRYIQENTKIPVLGHSSGICHIYVDSTADPKKAVTICHDARVQYPAACNAMKILLIHDKVAPKLLPKIAKRLVGSGVRIRACPTSLKIIRSSGIPVEKADDNDWSTEYLELVLPVKTVSGVDEAIEHINRYGSHHTDSILSEELDSIKKFLNMIDSSTVIHNASTRFSDGYRYGLGAEVGISTNKIHARGPVGLEGLVTTKYILLGSGQKVSDYIGKDATHFLHEKETLDWEGRLSAWGR